MKVYVSLGVDISEINTYSTRIKKEGLNAKKVDYNSA